MQRFGMSANLMSLAGLAIGIGMMVDGAVVMVENAFRHLAHTHSGSSRVEIVGHAAREVAQPVAFAILIIIVVFLPLFLLTGLEGKLFRNRCLLQAREQGLARLRRGAQQQDPCHPAPRVRIARRRISAAEGSHLHAPGTLNCLKITHTTS